MRRRLESIKEFHEALTNNPNFRKRIWDNGTECLYKDLYKPEIDTIIEERNILFGKENIDYIIKLKESRTTIEF